MSDGLRILRAADADVRDRGRGVRTAHLVTAAVARAGFATGITEFAPGAALGLHFHDCDESVLVLEGTARFETRDATNELGPNDATFVPAGEPHRFANAGESTMRLFFVYGSSSPTRTMVDSGETFPIGSQQDVVG
jgi:mannose-6-phosphate isomerase-like protein (cupin superfamily)